MPTGEATYKFSIYKLADAATCKAELVAKGYALIPLQEGNGDFEFYLAASPPIAPKWAKVFKPLAQDPSVLDVKNKSWSFVLITTAGGVHYAVCGGNGSFQVQKYIEEGFGLSVVSKVVEPNKIKYKKSKPLSGRTAQEESVYKEYYNYDFDTSNWGKITKEILGEVSQSALTEFFGLSFASKHKIRLDGKNSISINRAIGIEGLRTLISKLAEVEAKEPKIHIINGFKEVDDAALREQLSEKIVETLGTQFAAFISAPDDFEETNIGISYSDAKEFLLCGSFVIQLGDHVEFFETFALGDVFAFLQRAGKNSFRDSHLNGVHITGLDADDNPKLAGPLRSFIYAELLLASTKYFFIDKKWFEVEQSFQDSVDEKVRQILSNSSAALGAFALPDWKLIGGKIEIEGAYIDHVCTGNLHKLHTKHVIISGSDKCEACDIVDTRTAETGFIFVKRGLGSDFREMLAQARSSAELFIRDKTFRQKAKDKVEEEAHKTGINFEPNPFFVLAFTDKSTLRGGQSLVDRLTTIVKTDLVHTFEFLDNELRAHKSGLYEIPHEPPSRNP